MVALRKESVDRNILCTSLFNFWLVALRKESVDRNSVDSGELVKQFDGRSPQGERG